MLALSFEEAGRKKRIERRFTLKCLMCGATLVCPDGTEEWGFLNSVSATAFRALHVPHGSERTVGAEIVETAVE